MTRGTYPTPRSLKDSVIADTSPVTSGLLPAGREAVVSHQLHDQVAAKALHRVGFRYATALIKPHSLQGPAATDHVVLGPAVRLSAGVATWLAAAVAVVLSGGA